MKKCPICYKETGDDDLSCNNCEGFFQWKYGKNWQRKYQRFLNLLKKKSSLETTKLNRRYKNE